RLGCTPVVNLYVQRAEPAALTHAAAEYRVVPDARRPLAHEVYSVERVTALSSEGAAAEYEPFFSVKHADAGRASARYWHGTRRRAVGTEDRPDFGSEVYLALMDLDFTPNGPAE